MIDEIAAHCVETKENKLMLDHRRDRLMCKPFSCRVTYAWVCTILSVFFSFFILRSADVIVAPLNVKHGLYVLLFSQLKAERAVIIQVKMHALRFHRKISEIISTEA